MQHALWHHLRKVTFLKMAHGVLPLSKKICTLISKNQFCGYLLSSSFLSVSVTFTHLSQCLFVFSLFCELLSLSVWHLFVCFIKTPVHFRAQIRSCLYCASLLACCVFTSIFVCFRPCQTCYYGIMFLSFCFVCYRSLTQTRLFFFACVRTDRWRSCWQPWKRWSRSWSPWRPSCRPPSSPWPRRRPTWPHWGRNAESTWRRCWKWSKTFIDVLHPSWTDTLLLAVELAFLPFTVVLKGMCRKTWFSPQSAVICRHSLHIPTHPKAPSTVHFDHLWKLRCKNMILMSALLARDHLQLQLQLGEALLLIYSCDEVS